MQDTIFNELLSESSFKATLGLISFFGSLLFSAALVIYRKDNKTLREELKADRIERREDHTKIIEQLDKTNENINLIIREISEVKTKVAIHEKQLNG